MTSTETSIYSSNAYSTSESSFGSIEPSRTVFTKHQQSQSHERSSIFDNYNDLIQLLSALLFAIPSRIEIKVLFRALQAWLNQHGDGLKFSVLNCPLQNIEFKANYMQQPVSLVLLIDETNHGEIPYGVILQTASDTLVCFYIVPERVSRIAEEREQPDHSIQKRAKLVARSDAEHDERQTFAMWVRANMAYFAKI